MLFSHRTTSSDLTTEKGMESCHHHLTVAWNLPGPHVDGHPSFPPIGLLLYLVFCCLLPLTSLFCWNATSSYFYIDGREVNSESSRVQNGLYLVFELDW